MLNDNEPGANFLDAKADARRQGNKTTPGSPLENLSSEQKTDALPACDELTLTRLAKLSLVEYDRIRESEARKLGIRTTTLDASVKSERKGQVDTALCFESVDPWPEPIDPAQLLTDISETVQRFIV